jgi:hypothetical protein
MSWPRRIKYSSIFTYIWYRKDESKELHVFTDVEYKQILGSVKTRWLPLQLEITTAISMFPALKSCFLSTEKCQTILREMFNDLASLVWNYEGQSVNRSQMEVKQL